MAYTYWSILKKIHPSGSTTLAQEKNRINEVVINDDVVRGKGKPIVAYSKKKSDVETRA